MAVRDGWDRHVQFGLDHPAFYVLLYGRIEPGRPCAITGPAHTMLCELLTAAAQHGLLRVPAAQITLPPPPPCALSSKTNLRRSPQANTSCCKNSSSGWPPLNADNPGTV